MSAFPRELPLQPVDRGEGEPPIRFRDLPKAAQRELVDRYLRKYPMQDSLIGEAINEGEYAESIRTCLLVGDTAQVGLLVDRAVREYLGDCVEREHYSWMEEA